MNTYTIYKKRDGQPYGAISTINARDYEHAKKQFAQMMWNSMIAGEHGDDLHYENDESIAEWVAEGHDGSWYTEPGIYMENQLFASESERDAGIDFFTEDVYSWTIDEDRTK